MKYNFLSPQGDWVYAVSDPAHQQLLLSQGYDVYDAAGIRLQPIYSGGAYVIPGNTTAITPTAVVDPSTTQQQYPWWAVLTSASRIGDFLPTHILAGNPATGTTAPLSDLASIGQAQAAGLTLLRSNMTPFIVTPFLGGTLLDYLPLNVYLSAQWYTGQKEALQPYWSNGQIPVPPAAILNLPVVDMPASIAALTGAGMNSLPWWVWGIAVYVAYKIVK